MVTFALTLSAVCGVLLGLAIFVAVRRRGMARRLRPEEALCCRKEEALSYAAKAATKANHPATSDGEYLIPVLGEAVPECTPRLEPELPGVPDSSSEIDTAVQRDPAHLAPPLNGLRQREATAYTRTPKASLGTVASEDAYHQDESISSPEAQSGLPSIVTWEAKDDTISGPETEIRGEEREYALSPAAPRRRERRPRLERVVRLRPPTRTRCINTILRGGARRKAPDESGSVSLRAARNNQPRDSGASGERRSPDESGKVRAELITWWAQGAQHVGLDVSREGSINAVHYESGVQLSLAAPHRGPQERAYVLTHMGSVIVETSIRVLKVELQPHEILIFKLHGEKGAQGRRVRFASQGKYVMVCPKSYEIEGLASRESCSISGYAAYVFECADNSRPPVVVLPTGERRALETRQAYRFDGSVFRSDSDPRPLYLGMAPRLVAPEPFGPGTTVVVGTEGRDTRRQWRCKLYVAPGTTELALENALEKTNGGWFFARVYEDDDVLLDSLDFLFLRPVKSVKVSPHPVFPGPEGHSSVRAVITHDDSAKIVTEQDLLVTRKDGLTIVNLPPDPERDEVRLWVEVDGKRYRDAAIAITSDRAWFGLGECNRKPDSWLDRPFELSREDFKPTKTTSIWVKLPRRLVGTPLTAGFDDKRAKKYAASSRSRLFTIPLRDFYDQPELSAPGSPSVSVTLYLWHWQSNDAHIVATVRSLPAARLWRACGRSKNVYAVALMRHPGSGQITCNGSLLTEFCQGQPQAGLSLISKIIRDDSTASMLEECSVEVTTYGGAENSVRRCKAVAHGIANVLKQRDPSLAPKLKALGLGGARPREDRFKPDWLR